MCTTLKFEFIHWNHITEWYSKILTSYMGNYTKNTILTKSIMSKESRWS